MKEDKSRHLPQKTIAQAWDTLELFGRFRFIERHLEERANQHAAACASHPLRVKSKTRAPHADSF